MLTKLNCVRLSIVVCTYNRSKLLQRCLNALVNQSASTDSFEVIIIDNNSTDDTLAISAEYAQNYKNIRCLKEDRIGLSHARNRGWREAKGTYVAYLDDDAEPVDSWLSTIFDFVGRRPDVVMFGGPYVSFSLTSRPYWFPPEYGVMDFGAVERSLDIRTEFVEGLNMVIRKDELEKSEGFHSDLGMSGTKVYYGEETRLQILLSREGHTIYYVPGMAVRHLLPAYKMSLLWLLKSVYANGRSSCLTFDSNRTLLQHMMGVAYGIYFFFNTLPQQLGQPLKRLIYYSLRPIISECGALVEFFVRLWRGKS